MPTKIGTHSGPFQADDVFACAVLSVVHMDDVEIVRSRDPEVLAMCEFVVDVGGEYNPKTHRYDHHQKGRAGTRSNGVLYSSFGLVWKHFGSELVGGVDAVLHEVDRALVQPVDAIDNGQELAVEGVPSFEGVMAHGYSVNQLIGSFVPTWREEPDFDSAFLHALLVAKTVLIREIRQAQSRVAALEVVRKAIVSAEDPRILVLETGCPWQKTVIENAPEALFVVYAHPGGDGTWMVQCVPSALGSFGKRKALPELWAGLSDAEFQKATDVSDGVFCHPGRFICGAKSKNSAMRLALMAADS